MKSRCNQGRGRRRTTSFFDVHPSSMAGSSSWSSSLTALPAASGPSNVANPKPWGLPAGVINLLKAVKGPHDLGTNQYVYKLKKLAGPTHIKKLFHEIIRYASRNRPNKYRRSLCRFEFLLGHHRCILLLPSLRKSHHGRPLSKGRCWWSHTEPSSIHVHTRITLHLYEPKTGGFSTWPVSKI